MGVACKCREGLCVWNVVDLLDIGIDVDIDVDVDMG